MNMISGVIVWSLRRTESGGLGRMPATLHQMMN